MAEKEFIQGKVTAIQDTQKKTRKKNNGEKYTPFFVSHSAEKNEKIFPSFLLLPRFMAWRRLCGDTCSQGSLRSWQNVNCVISFACNSFCPPHQTRKWPLSPHAIEKKEMNFRPRPCPQGQSEQAFLCRKESRLNAEKCRQHGKKRALSGR